MSLTEAAYYVRRALPFVILGGLIFLILFYAIQLLFLILQANKKPNVHIDPTFGVIKNLVINEASSSAGINFKLDTIEGKPVTATESAKVFFLPPTTSRFGYRERIYLMAKTLGFDTENTKYKLIGKQAIFSEPNQKLTIDITNFNFNYQYFFEKEPDLFRQTLTPITKESEDTAIDFLQSIGRYPDELAKGKTNTIFFKYNPEEKTMITLDRNIEANITEVDFYRLDVEAVPQPIPIVSPNYYNSPNYVLMMFTPSGYRILRAQINFHEKSEEQVGIYPLRSGDSAYEYLKSGKALVVSHPQGEKDVVIRKMFIGYFDPEVYQDYLQPVYVFLGEGNFVAYVPAITDEYLTK